MVHHRNCIGTKQAERLKSRERRTKVDRLDGQWAQLLIGLLDRIGFMVNRLNCR